MPQILYEAEGGYFLMSKRKKLFKTRNTDNEANDFNQSSGFGNPLTRIMNKRKKTANSADTTAVSPSPMTIDVAHPGRRSQSNNSILITDTKAMERSRRLAEQQGERALGAVKAREHSPEQEVQPSPEGELQNNILQHPALDSQRFDGVDPNLNPEPPLNSVARREFDNERREQEMEKQLRLGNMPKFSTAPTPQGPR